ncbi:MAG: DNA-binding domain-containing protein [Chthoniobacterales bacterium]
MKRSKPGSSKKTLAKKPLKSPKPSLKKIRSRADLMAVQRAMAKAIFRPLTTKWDMQKQTESGADMNAVANTFIRPNDRLSAFERLELYNRQYWFRLLDCFYDDYPGLQALMSGPRFLKLATAYLKRHPSESFTLRNLGKRLEQFLREEPQWTAPRTTLALDMVRFEWAQVLAFDEAAKPPVTPDDLLDNKTGRIFLNLQPYLCLLELHYTVDEFLIALKKSESGGLRTEASNAMDSAPESKERPKRIPLPKKKKIHLAVHRHENVLYHKRLEPEAFAILTAIGSGKDVETACIKAVTASPRKNIDWPAEIKDWFANWSSLGWFCR